jgi:cysteinyl-tRNA synthetase
VIETPRGTDARGLALRGPGADAFASLEETTVRPSLLTTSTLALLVLLGTLAAVPSAAADRAAERARKARLAAVASWGYQLRRIDPSAFAAASVDLLVVDHAIAANRTFYREFTPGEVATMAARADGRRRIVLAYLSIGEAERYRFYWQPAWHEEAGRPTWLGAVNAQWAGNYLVRFWDPAWQRLVYGSPDAYLERILAQGFDGIYLDRADAWSEWTAERPSARRDMAALVARLAAHARGIRPETIVVMQNAEELIEEPSVRRSIDAIAKEDLVFGIDHQEGRNSAADLASSVAHLRRARRAGLPVLLVEYLTDAGKASEVSRFAAREGFIASFALRGLHALTTAPPTPGDAPRPHFPTTPPPPPTASPR